MVTREQFSSNPAVSLYYTISVILFVCEFVFVIVFVLVLVDDTKCSCVVSMYMYHVTYNLKRNFDMAVVLRGCTVCRSIIIIIGCRMTEVLATVAVSA